MDTEKFETHLKCVNANGMTFNLEEKMNLLLAFNQM